MGHTAHTIAKVNQRHKPTFALPKARHCATHGRPPLLAFMVLSLGQSSPCNSRLEYTFFVQTQARLIPYVNSQSPCKLTAKLCKLTAQYAKSRSPCKDTFIMQANSCKDIHHASTVRTFKPSTMHTYV